MRSRKLRKRARRAERQPFIKHLTELRERLFWYLGSLLLASLVGFLLNRELLDILTRPIDQPLYYSTPTGGLDVIIGTGFFFGFLISLPVLVYQILRFLEPAFPGRPQAIFKFLVFSGIFMILGVAFAYFVSLPTALYFLTKFGSEEIRPLLSTSSYFSFVSRYLLGFGLFFQLPIVMLFINKIRPLKVKSLLKQEKWVVLGSVILAAVLTPTPDIFNQILMALPIIVLYQLGVGLVFLTNKYRPF